MNELMVVFRGGGFVYFETDADTAWDALYEFEKACDKAKINIDNMEVAEAHLRDANGNETSDLRRF